MKNGSKALLGVAAIILITGTWYLWIEINLPEGEAYPWGSFFWKFLLSLIFLTLAIAVAYFGWHYFNDRGFKDLKLVDTTVAEREWVKAFIEATDMPRIYDKGEPLLPPGQRLLEIRNPKSPQSKQTAENFHVFEAHVYAGEKPGHHIIVTRLDKGQEWIGKNWNYWIRTDKTTSTYHELEDDFTIASSKTFDERVRMRKLDLMDEGYKPEELAALEQTPDEERGEKDAA